MLTSSTSEVATWKSKWSIELPTCSLPSYLFASQTGDIGDRPLIIDGEKPEHFLTHSSYRDWSKRLAAGLQKAGFKPGDRLLLFSPNTIFFSVVQFGVIMAGGIFTGANPGYVPRELAHQLRDSGATFMIVGEAVLDTALAAAQEVKLSKRRIFIFDDGTATMEGKAKSVRGFKPWTRLLASPAEAEAFRWPEFNTREEMDRTCVLNYSSGTTGVAKGVEITHRNYIANCCQVNYVHTLKPDFEEWRQRARGVALLPMYHAYGQVVNGVSQPLMGVPQYYMRKFDFLKLLDWVQKYRITNLSLVPPIVVAFTKRPEVKDYDLSTLESVGCGAAPLAKESIQEFENLFQGRARIRQGWGMTELTCAAVGFDPNNDAPDPSAVGDLNPNVECRIVDDGGADVAPGERGEIWIRAPNVMKGYWKRPEATAETLTGDGWLKTGDVGFRDAADLLHVVDRKKELIKVKGLQVAPAELEGLLLDHPHVDDAAVVGVTIKGEEMPRAYVVLRRGASVTPKGIAQWVAKKVSRHKRLEGGVVPVDAIPKNPSGKLLRKELRERAKKEVGDSEVRNSRL